MEEFRRVSIIIPVYNGADFLKEAIDSALCQTYPNCEVIVVNDGSADGGATEAVARSYGRKIRYFSKENGGVASALNFGIRQMTGDFFSWLSHDDLYLPDKILHQMKAYEHLPEDTILYAPYVMYYPELHLSVKVDFRKKVPAGMLQESVYPVFHRLINGCTVLFHKSHFDRIGYFNETLKTTQDYEFWFRLFREQRVFCCNAFDVKVRVNRQQGSRTLEEHGRDEDALWISLAAQATDSEMVRVGGTKRLFYLENAASCGRHGELEAAKFCAEQANEALERRTQILAGTSDRQDEEALSVAILEDRYEKLLESSRKRKKKAKALNKQNIAYLLYEIHSRGLAAGLKEVGRFYSFRHTT